jgi:histidine ammonia-lyase
MLQGQLSELANVVLNKEDISIERHVIDRIEESASLFAASPVYIPDAAASAALAALADGKVVPTGEEDNRFFPHEFCRAAIYGCVTSLLQGRSGVKYPVVQLLLDMLEFEVRRQEIK